MTALKTQILIVEDDPIWQKSFGEPLRELGYTVFPASTREEALQLLDRHPFNLVIMDINLTDVTGNTDGLLVADYINKLGLQAPIIVVSGTGEGQRVLREGQYQIFAEMQKDTFDISLFISTVRRALGGVEI